MKKEEEKAIAGKEEKSAKKGKKTKKGKNIKDKGKPKKKRFLLILSFLLLIAMFLGLFGIVDYGALYDTLMGNKATTAIQKKPVITGLQPQLASPQGISTAGGFEVTDAGARKVARIYEQMRPQSAADALKTLPPAEAVKVLIAMDEWRAGIILSKLDAKTSADLSAKLATAVAQKAQYDKLNNITP